MIKHVKNEFEKENILNYIGNNHDKCLYLYMDLLEYGVNNNNVKIWIQYINEEIKGVILKYYSGMHLYSKNSEINVEEIIELIKKEKPSIICAEKDIISKLNNELNDYITEYGWIRKLINNSIEKPSNIKIPDQSDYMQIAKLIYDDDDIGSSYNLKELANQLYERNRDKYTRNYVIKENSKVVAHIATGAENDKICTIAYLVTDKEYRKKGYATQLINYLSRELIDEGKEIYLVNYSQESTKLYDKLGFQICCKWGKLYKNLKGDKND